MLIVGGFNGVMKGDVMAYRMPRTVVYKNSSGSIVPGQHCGLYDEKSKYFNMFYSFYMLVLILQVFCTMYIKKQDHIVPLFVLQVTTRSVVFLIAYLCITRSAF